jgi:pimeloyl-ACP methyl ester carboxylesterase
MPFAELDDVRLFYTDQGQGVPPMLFVHGFTCDSSDWIWQLCHFEKNHRVVAVDLRGHGRSSVPGTGYDALTYAADLAALLVLLECPPVVALGHSMGGLVVSALAVEHPERVRAVVAVDAAYLVSDETTARVAPVTANIDSEDPVPAVQILLGSSDKPSSPPALRAWHLRRAAGMPVHVLRQSLHQMQAGGEVSPLRQSGVRYLARRKCPVLSVYAEPSRVEIETALFADPFSRALAWDGVGHWFHQERPDEFNSLVDNWLRSIN